MDEEPIASHGEYWSNHYVMLPDGSTRRAETEDEAHAAWSSDRVVAKTVLPGGVAVSTVFIVIDHQHGNGPPLVFETMAFGGEAEGDCQRYSTRAEAEAGHVAMCRRHGGEWYALYEREREAARGA